MIQLHTKRRCCYINEHCNKFNTEFIEFDLKNLKQIEKCYLIEYKICRTIITNIPLNIIKIIFCGWFNVDIQPFLHSEFNSLEFGHEFNQLVDNLPLKLKHLVLGDRFNQSVNNLPQQLESIIFGGGFNQPVDMLPESLQMIYLSGKFNHPVNNLPTKLKKITLSGFKFNHTINTLPDSVEMLVLNPGYNLKIDKLPKNLTLIKFSTRGGIDKNILRQLTDADIQYGH